MKVYFGKQNSVEFRPYLDPVTVIFFGLIFICSIQNKQLTRGEKLKSMPKKKTGQRKKHEKQKARQKEIRAKDIAKDISKTT